MTYGFRKDHCNSGYSYAQHLLLDELSPIGNNYRKFQALNKRLQENGNIGALRDDASDVLKLWVASATSLLEKQGYYKWSWSACIRLETLCLAT